MQEVVSKRDDLLRFILLKGFYCLSYLLNYQFGGFHLLIAVGYT